MKTMGQIYEGQKILTKTGYTITVAKIVDKNNILVQYHDRHFQKVNYASLIQQNTVNVFQPTNNGVGCKGLGNHPINRKVNGKNKHTKLYETWTSLLKSMYNPRSKSYGKQWMCNDWLNFQEFSDWYEANYIELARGERLILTNNLLDKNCTEFSPETSFLLPETIFKALHFKKTNEKESGLPIGVKVQKSLYAANIKKTIIVNNEFKSKGFYLGAFNTPEEAFNAYKVAKEEYLKELAERYIDYIPYKAYDALYNYTIEIND